MTNMIKKPEILSPAGNYEKLTFASAYGADAVYFAGQLFGMRASADNFSFEEMKKGVELLHSQGKKAYLTLNTMPRNNELDVLDGYLDSVSDTGIDAVIVADLGVIPLVKKYAPRVKLHISTQASIVNYSAANMYHQLGADRIVLARELPLNEIAELRARTDKALEIEAFVHGSMCISYSGRCLLSTAAVPSPAVGAML